MEAAIGEIERRGLARLTVRGVAAAADMNVAAVNYHFRSKQALVEAALAGTIEHMVGDTAGYLARLRDDPPRVLAELLGYYLEGALRFPGICKAHLHEAFVADDYSGPFPTLFAPSMLALRDALSTVVPGLDSGQAAQRAVLALSATFFPAFFAGLYRPLGALDTPADRLGYVRAVASATLARAGVSA